MTSPPNPTACFHHEGAQKMRHAQHSEYQERKRRQKRDPGEGVRSVELYVVTYGPTTDKKQYKTAQGYIQTQDQHAEERNVL